MPDIYLPTLYPSQVEAYKLPARFKALRCGRRWGKTDLLKTIACDGAVRGEPIGWFTPDYKIQSEAFNEIAETLDPVKKNSSKVEGRFSCITGGRIDFWTLENPRAGRSRKYKKVIIDEAAFTKPNMLHIWETSIKPALLDYRGTAYVASTPNGQDPDNFFYQICEGDEAARLGFKQYHAPTHQNPYLPRSELKKLQRDNDPDVYRQEYLAEFVNWSGKQFFQLHNLLGEDGNAIPWPQHVDGVFAVIDSAIKEGVEHDGTGITYFAHTAGKRLPLCILDWDVQQIEGAFLDQWLPAVFKTLEIMSQACLARRGIIGVFIEDKASGTILLQQAVRNGWALCHAIDSKLTAVGKDERAISVSGYVYRREVQITQPAYDRVVRFKGVTRNHLLTQVLGFRIGDKKADRRQDDLLDTFTYGVSIGLGNSEGY